MSSHERRIPSGRRNDERRQRTTSIIEDYIDYSGPDRRNGNDRRAITDRRR